MKVVVTFWIVALASLLGCKQDHCGPREIADSTEEFYAFGRVINFLTGEPEMGVQLLFMDQVGGSRILKLDSTTASKSNGCFYFENKRDLTDLQTYLDQNPSLTVNHLNQTIRSHDKDYFYLFTQQSSDRFIGRAKLNASEEVLVQVTPLASIRIDHQTNEQIKYNFRWEFQDPALDFSRGKNSYSFISAQGIGNIPAETILDVFIYDSNDASPLLLHKTSVQASWKSVVEISF